MSSAKKIASPVRLSQAAMDHIDHWLKKFPVDQKQSAVIASLMFVQKENDGWLTEGLMDAVAAYLEMPKIAVYEVASFYTMFELKPVGKIKLEVCTNISCMLNGSDKIVNHLRNKLGIDFGQTTEDGKYSLKEVECLGACGGAPMMQVGDDYHENLSVENLDPLLDSLERKL
jgi:NADH-quinone oxidoreductase subunit E